MKAFTCCLITKDETGASQLNEDFTGVAISEHIVPTPDDSSATGVRFQAMVGVLWDDHRSPSPSYHAPDELHWLGIPDLETDEDDEEDFEDEEEAENFVQYVQAQE